MAVGLAETLVDAEDADDNSTSFENIGSGVRVKELPSNGFIVSFRDCIGSAGKIQKNLTLAQL